MSSVIEVAQRVREALTDGRGVVALESTLFAHGLPSPQNFEVAHDLEQIVERAGAEPATIGVVAGRPVVGLDASQIRRLAGGEATKLSTRDLAPAVATGADGATTVAATAALAAAVGIGVFATGGLGGVHRAPAFDESADLVTLARTPLIVVCAGVKSILNVGATLERLETLGVTVVGYRTRRFPGFYLTDSGFDLEWSAESPEAVAEIARARGGLDTTRQAIVVAQPLPEELQLDPAAHDAALAEGLALAAESGISGQGTTPFLLDHLAAATGGASVEANVALVRRNARLAAQIAVALGAG